MITLKVEIDNPITPDFYNNLIANLQFHRLTCTCGHSACLSVHGYYNRSLKTPEGKATFHICRVICACCGHTHALLLSSFVPYSQISLAEQAQIITLYESNDSLDSLMVENPSVDENNCHYVIRQYLRHWKQKLLSEKIFLSPISQLISNCFATFFRQFMQIRCTPNILFVNTT